LTDRLRKRPKIELHVHLEGCLSPGEARALRDKHSLPHSDEEIAALYRHASLGEFLAHFGALVGFLREPSDVAWLLRRCLGRLARQGVIYAEIRISPSVWERHGLPPDEVMEALLRLWRSGGPVRFQFIVDAVRQWERPLLERDLELAARHRGRGVAGFGLGGDEVAAPARCFQDLALECRSLGMPLIPHAGESTGPEAMAETLAVCSPPRIAHGIGAARDGALLAELARRGTHLEVAPTSNLRTKVVPKASLHPLAALWAAGVSLSLGTDDPALFATTLSGELRWAHRHAGWSEADMARSTLCAAQAALLPRDGREALASAVRAGWGG
jgi:aminodeoxyfutalosine deaminase